MKLRNVLWAGGIAYVTYQLIRHHDTILQETKDSLSLLQQTQEAYTDVQQQMDRVASQKEPLQQLLSDWQHTFRVYQQGISGNRLEIQRSLKQLQETLEQNKKRLR